MDDENTTTSFTADFMLKVATPRRALEYIGLKEGMKIADLGCGSGYFSIPAAQMVGGSGEVYAIDVLKSALESVKSKAKIENVHNIKTIWANLEVPGSTKLPGGAVDISFISSALFQSDSPDKFLEEAKRILKPGGRLVVFEWEVGKIAIGPRAKHRIAERDIMDECKKVGLSFEERFKPGKFHYGLIFEK